MGPVGFEPTADRYPKGVILRRDDPPLWAGHSDHAELWALFFQATYIL